MNKFEKEPTVEATPEQDAGLEGKSEKSLRELGSEVLGICEKMIERLPSDEWYTEQFKLENKRGRFHDASNTARMMIVRSELRGELESLREMHDAAIEHHAKSKGDVFLSGTRFVFDIEGLVKRYMADQHLREIFGEELTVLSRLQQELAERGAS